MTSEKLKMYTARITQASKSELTVIMYEIIIEDLQEARVAINSNNKELLVKELKHASKFLNELMATLDYSYQLSYELMSLYIYVNKIILTSIVKEKAYHMDTALSIMNKLLLAFKEVAKEDTSGPVMMNTEQIYAGLTYGKGTLNEMYLDNQGNRGFMA